ncbi:acid phosphatase [Wilcoxina mikolae CBS 423.85]|nr:acid phosphatase [Wilcoxina mikolae CBS 423.85]
MLLQSFLFPLGFLFAVTNAQEVPSHSPTSSVSGKAFNRFVTIWLENTDYSKAAGDPNLRWLASRGITLSNYFGLTHPSMGNYIAVVSGDYFGTNNDGYTEVPSNTSTIADLLEDAGISWGEYQEGMPYTGFKGFEYENPETRANMYVRKHNPLVIFNSVAERKERLALIKNTTLFVEDLDSKSLPQWMFITPNMTSDGHDTSVTVAGAWTRDFLEPLLDNEYFIKDTLVLVTFDENHSYTTQNRVFSILLGGAVPQDQRGTTDDNYYDHYSQISTVCANWNLPTLGRFDVGANVFSLVASKTGDKVRTNTALSATFLNKSYPGIFNTKQWAPQPVPNISLVVNGREVSKSIKAKWENAKGARTYYSGDLVLPDARHPPLLAIFIYGGCGYLLRWLRWWG